MLVYAIQLIIVHKLLPQLMFLPNEKRKVLFFFNSHARCLFFFFLSR